MRLFHFFPLWVLILLPVSLFAQDDHRWEFSTEWNVFLIPDQSFLSPVISADYNHFHVEGRYFDEDIDTGSIFVGYNFYAGSTFEMKATPMIGGLIGNSNGIAPGLSFELNYKKLNISIEAEYFFSTEGKESNFFYAWSELAYSPVEWIWFGFAGQRTRVYETGLDVQRGLLLGFGKEKFAVTGYWMNIGGENSFGLLSFEYVF